VLLASGKKALKSLQMTDQDSRYLISLSKKVSLKRSHFERLLKDAEYETPLYLVHQMFEQKWDPGLGHIVELDN